MFILRFKKAQTCSLSNRSLHKTSLSLMEFRYSLNEAFFAVISMYHASLACLFDFYFWYCINYHRQMWQSSSKTRFSAATNVNERSVNRQDPNRDGRKEKDCHKSIHLVHFSVSLFSFTIAKNSNRYMGGGRNLSWR